MILNCSLNQSGQYIVSFFSLSKQYKTQNRTLKIWNRTLKIKNTSNKNSNVETDPYKSSKVSNVET